MKEAATLLIVDDVPANIGVVADSLEQLGFRVLVAQDGEEGLARARHTLPDLILLDVMMPGLDGFEVCRRLKADAGTREIPVIFMTALADGTNKLAGFEAGGVDYVTKPVDVDELRARIATQLKLRRAQQQLQRQNAELQLAAKVFDSTMDGILVTDGQARILSVNPAFTAITGYRAEEAIGRKTSLLRSDHHDEAFYRELWATLEREGGWEGEVWNRRKNGEAYLEWLSIARISGGDDQPPRFVGVFNDITELRRQAEHIHHLAYHDPLTDLPNRALLLDRLEHRLETGRRDRQRLGVIFIDLDHFKQVNDSLGHDVGDRLLQEIAGRLRDCLRRSDTVARMGGDEFVVLIEQLERPEDCLLLVEKIQAVLAKPVELPQQALVIGTSLGIACFPDDGEDAITLMKHADTAMYAAKAEGRNTYRFFQAAMTEQAERRLKLEMELHRAIDQGQLELFYQPKVYLSDGTFYGVEALVRWRHPTRGLVSPTEFIPVAEACGLIGRLGDWVLEEACRQSRRWQEQGQGTIPIAVNVSAQQLADDRLIERVVALTRQYGVDPASLEIELTESVLMRHPQQAARMLGALRARGVRVAVDDFGTGYSSLAYLRRLPIDVLKIDRSFVHQADREEGDAQIIRTILALAGTLALTVVAEGVETARQAALLGEQRCALAQGFFYAPPLPADELERWLADQPTLPVAPLS